MISFENDSFNDSSFDDDRDQSVSSKPPKTQFYNFSNGGAIRSLHDSCCAIIAKSMAFESVQEYAETVIQCPLPEHSQMRIAYYSFPSTTNEIKIYSPWQHRLLQSQRTCK
jgi:hypothetical protein